MGEADVNPEEARPAIRRWRSRLRVRVVGSMMLAVVAIPAGGVRTVAGWLGVVLAVEFVTALMIDRARHRS